MYPFQKLKVWHAAHAFALECYARARVIDDRALRWQLQRAAQSIPANLVEGASSHSQAEFARYLGIAIASAQETKYHLLFSRDAELLDAACYDELYGKLDQVLAQLGRLTQAVRRNVKAQNGPSRK
ncbi:MAG: four helix bundle protein [Gemmatimonadota bacterium]